MQTEEFLRNRFGVDRDTISKWRYEFSKYLSPSAIQKDKTRIYTESDIRVFDLIYEYWEDNPDYENIRIMLDSGYQNDERYFEQVYLSTPVFKKHPPDGFDEEPVDSGLIFDFRAMQEPILVARTYQYAGNTLVSEALGRPESLWELAYPIFYMYRHAVELYLKIIVDYEYHSRDKEAHSLSKLVEDVQKMYQKKINPWAKDFLDKFAEVDGSGTAFRYPGEMPEHVTEWWVDLRQLRIAMDFLCREFEHLIRSKQESVSGLE